MKLYEYEGKRLFKRYDIPIPRGVLVSHEAQIDRFSSPLVLKAQVLSGNRNGANGIVFVHEPKNVRAKLRELFSRTVGGEHVKKVLVEEKISAAAEYYVSLSYSTDTRTPLLGLSLRGGSGIAKAVLMPIDATVGVPAFQARKFLRNAKFSSKDLQGVTGVLQNLWRLFAREHVLLAEINPLFKTLDGNFIAGDAKIILDDEKYIPKKQRFLEMDGDIAILASGGGASMLSIDTLLHHGGKPANYTEYSGNPPASVVKTLTKRVLQRPGLKGCWVVGGTANFTDIYETTSGFVEGLLSTRSLPRYPIVIRRDGPRQKEAFNMLREVGAKYKLDLHLFGSETPIAESARIIVQHAYNKKR